MVFDFLKKHFGSEKDSGGTDSRQQAVAHEGYTIVPMPKQHKDGWTTEGLIEREVNGEIESRHFIRAETHMERDQAISHTIMKGRRIVDEERRMNPDHRD
jgi:hypothetical protein